jgi:hypothetical protein
MNILPALPTLTTRKFIITSALPFSYRPAWHPLLLHHRPAISTLNVTSSCHSIAYTRKTSPYQGRLSMFPIPCNRPMALRCATSRPPLVAHLTLFSFHPRFICLIGWPLTTGGYVSIELDRYIAAITLITLLSCTQPAKRHASHLKAQIPDTGHWCSRW